MVIIKFKTIFLISFVIQLSIVLSHAEAKKPNDAYDLYWTEPITPESIQYATAEVTKIIMNGTVDPCENFYDYACGNWDLLNPIPEHSDGLTIFKVIHNRVQYYLRQKLFDSEVNSNAGNVEDSSSENDSDKNEYDFSEAEEKLRNFGKSCINRDEIEKNGITGVVDYFETLDGWPFSELDTRNEPFDWLNLTAHLNQAGFSIVFSTGPGYNKRLVLQSGVLYLGDEKLYNITNEFQKNRIYYIYGFAIKSIFKRLGIDVRNMQETINSIIDFEVGLASFYDESIELSANRTKITLERLQEIVPSLDWATFFSTLYRRPIEMSQGITIIGEEDVKNLVEYLSKSKPDIIAKYSFFQFAANVDRFLTMNLYEKEKRRLKKLKGDRIENCIHLAKSFMPKALSAFFVRKNSSMDTKREVERMFVEIKSELYDFINETFWIDDYHKVLANKKLDIMKANVGYKEDILNHDTLNKEYSDVVIKSDSFIGNVIYLLRHKHFQRQAAISKMDNETEFNVGPLTVNAFYNPEYKGQMELPLGILNPPFYHHYAPGWAKYGGIGVVIGHELVHGFDSDNMLLDTDGNLQDFKSLKVIGKYYARSVCMAQQYSKYQFKNTNITLDGSLTLDENISDNGGMALALEAYRKWLARNPDLVESEKIPGLDLSPEQLFFLSHAQSFCESIKLETISRYMKYASHAPLKFRVIGAVSNSYSFSDAYSCTFGAPMNPVRKCTFN